MFRKNTIKGTSLTQNTSYPGERIEEKVNRIVNNKEPIKDGAPQIFTERKDGVRAEYDVRTDKWEIAVDSMDKVAEQHRTNRKNFHDKLEKDNKSNKKDPGGEPSGDKNGGKSGGTTPTEGKSDKPSQ